jgi:hypothetical protein
MSNETARRILLSFVLRHSLDIRASTFVIALSAMSPNCAALNLHIALHDVWLLGRNMR